MKSKLWLLMFLLILPVAFANETNTTDLINYTLIIREDFDYKYSCPTDSNFSFSNPDCAPTTIQYVNCLVARNLCDFPGLYDDLESNMWVRNGKVLLLIGVGLYLLRKKKVI